jgi:hypothetical protein
MSRFHKFAKLCGKLSIVFVVLFFLCLGMGIEQSGHKSAISPAYLFTILMVLAYLSVICFVIYVIGLFKSGEKVPQSTESVEASLKRRSPVLAASLSLVIGAGQLYNGQLLKAIFVWMLFLFSAVLIGSLPVADAWKNNLFLLGMLLVWLYAITDAYTTARKINEGRISCRGSNLGCAVVFIIVILFLIAISMLRLKSAREYASMQEQNK